MEREHAIILSVVVLSKMLKQITGTPPQPWQKAVCMGSDLGQIPLFTEHSHTVAYHSNMSHYFTSLWH